MAAGISVWVFKIRPMSAGFVILCLVRRFASEIALGSEITGSSRIMALLSTLLNRATGLILKRMEFSDFFNVGSGLADTVKMVFFRMLPRSAQIEKVRAELNRGLLKKYGLLTSLEIDKHQKMIRADLNLKGENTAVRITLSPYRLIQETNKNPLFEPGTIEVSREWLDTLIKNLVKTSIIPERIEIKNPLHQVVVQSIL